MSGVEAEAWWVEVEDVRERIERRRAREAHGDHAGDGPSRRPGVAPAWDAAARTRAEAASRDDDAPAPRRPGSARAWEAAAAAAPSSAPVTTRRTVRIRGQAIPAVVAPRLRPVDDPEPLPAEPAPEATRPEARRRGSYAPRARPRTRPSERLVGGSPDRLAAWAFGLALLALLVAAISAHGL